MPAVSTSLSSGIPKHPWDGGGQLSTAERSPEDPPIS